MVNETLQTVQAKLSELALSLPELQKTEQWSEILRELDGSLRSAHRQELLLETVAAISDAASSILAVEDLLRVAVNLIQDYFDLYYVGIFLTDEANEWAVLRAATGEMGQRLLEGKHQLKINDQSLIGWSIYHRQSQIALDVDEVISFHSPLLPETRSQMILPLINRGQVIGALDVQSSKPAAFTQEDITLFQTLADQLANTIQNAQLFTENTRLLDQAENSRRFLKTVIEHIPDSIFIKDKSHTLVEMNQANAQVIGQPQPELLGKTDRDFFPPALADLFYQRDNEVFATNQIVATEDKTIWGDGHEHIAYTRLIPIPNSAGQPEYLLGISQDVTEERAREAERESLLAETAALYLGGQAIASALSERQIFEAIFEQIRYNDPCEISAFRFFMVDNEPTWAELRLNWQKRNNPSYAPGTRFYLPEVPQRELFTRGSALFMDNIATDDRLSDEERASFAPTGACSAAILPLIAARQRLGAISVYFTTPHLFTEEMQRLWLAMADQVGIALTNRLLIEEAAYRATRMETAAEVARAASSILEVQELLNSAVALICDRFNLYYVGAFLVDEAKEWAVLTAGTGEAGQIQLQKQHRLKIGGESMIGWSAYHRQPRIALDVGKEAVRFQNPDLPQTRSEIALPLIYHHEVIGALTVQSEEQADFSREDIIVLQTMADQLANAVVNARLYQQAQQEIGERKKTEALYQSLVDNIPQNVFRKDRAGRFVFGNRSFCHSLNVSLDELIGQTDFDVYPPDLAEKYNQADQKVLETGEITETVEENLPATGHKIYVRMVKSPIFDPSGEIVGTQGIFWDITERKQAEEARQKALARTQLLYNISEALATLINRRAAFETVLGEYLLLLSLSRGGLLLIDPAGEYNTLEALYIDGKVVEPGLTFPAQEDLITQYLQKNPFPLVIEDVSIHPLTQHNQAIRGQVEAMLLIPIVTRGDVVGIIGADATEKGHLFTPDDVEIGKAIADQLAIWLDNHQLLTEAQYRSERLQTAAEVSRAASSILDVNELINTSVNLIRDQFDFYYVGLFMVNEAREWAVLQGGTGEAGRIQIANEHKLKIGGESMIGWCIQNRQARIALDVGQEDVRFRNPVLPDTHSEMALPLKSRDEVIGALSVQSTEHTAFSAEDITLLQTMADQLANAIQNARLFESATQARQEAEALLKDTRALQQFSQMLAGTLQAPEILDIFFNACAQVIGFDYAQFCLVDKYQGRVRAIAGFGIPESLIKRSNHVLDSEDILADIVRTGHTEILTGWDDRFDRETFEAEKHVNWVRVFTPVSLRQENIGLVEAGFNKNANQTIEQAHVKLLRAFIDQTALALDNAQRYEASQKAARREALIKEITTKVRSSTNVDTILQTTVKELGDALSSKRTYVHLVSPVNPGETN